MAYRPRKLGLETHSSELEYLREEVNLIDRDDQDGFEEDDPQPVPWFRSTFKQRRQIIEPGPIHGGWGPIPSNGSYINWQLKTMGEALKRKIKTERRKVDQLELSENDFPSLELLEDAQVCSFNTADGIFGIERPAIELFPQEVWRMILGNLTDWPDRRACAKACVLFRKILDPTASKSILFEIFPDLQNYLRDDEDASCMEGCRVAAVNQFLEDFTTRPHTNPQAETGNDVFRVGRLLRSSNGLITEFGVVGNGLVEGDVTCILVSNAMEEWRMCNLDRQYRHIYKIMNGIWERGHDSCIELDIVVNDGFGSRSGRLITFLQYYGEHIRYLTLDCVGSDSWDLAYLLTVDQVRYLPNLRKLCLGSSSFVSLYRYDDLVPNSRHPLLLGGSKLETIQIYDGVLVVESCPCCGPDTILDPVIMLLLRCYRSQLGRLDLFNGFWKEVSWRGPWPSLTELYVAGGYSLETTSILHARIPNLRKLGLSMVECPSTDLRQKILEVISKLCATTKLNTLRLSFGSEGYYEEFGISDRLELEKPEYFELVTDSMIIIFRQK